jgi:hypothetical protein
VDILYGCIAQGCGSESKRIRTIFAESESEIFVPDSDPVSRSSNLISTVLVNNLINKKLICFKCSADYLLK